eukprot:6184992-Pleurochrysis_carterae.AAC.1
MQTRFGTRLVVEYRSRGGGIGRAIARPDSSSRRCTFACVCQASEAVASKPYGTAHGLSELISLGILQPSPWADTCANPPGAMRWSSSGHMHWLQCFSASNIGHAVFVVLRRRSGL